MHQSSGGGHKEGPRLLSRGLVQRVQRGKGPKQGSRLGQAQRGLCALPARPHTLAEATVEQIKVVLFVLGGLSREGGVKSGICPPLP